MVVIDPRILSKTVKTMTPKKERVEEAQVRGTVVYQSGEHYIRLDGATNDSLTPVANIEEGSNDSGFTHGDRVLVLIKNHQAIVTKNLTTGLQANAAKDASEFTTAITDEGITADRIIANDTFTNTIRANGITADEIIAGQAVIDTLDSNYAHITNGVIDNAEIGYADVNGLDANFAHITNGVIDNASISYADIDDLSAHYASIQNGVITNATIDQADVNDLDTYYAHITNGVIDNADIDVADVRNLSANYAHISNGVIDNAKIGHADVNGLNANYAHVTNGVIDNADIDVADVRNLSTTYATIANLEANYAHMTDGVIDNAKIGHADVNGLNANYAHVTNGVIDNADIDVADVRNLSTTYATIENLEANYAHMTNGVIDNAKIGHADVNGLNANYAHITNGAIDNAKIGYADVNGLSANYAHITNGTIDNAKIGHADVNGLNANYAHITNGTIDNAKIGYADVNNLDAHYASIDLANVNNAWMQNGVIKNGAIADAQIIGVSANKLTAGTIDASNITVTNLNASNITTGTINGQRIGTGSLSLDKLADAVYTESEIDGMLSTMQAEIDGAIETFTGTVVPTLNNAPASSWTTADEKAKHVGDVYYVVNAASQADGYCYRFAYDTQTATYGWVLIKDSDVTAALQRLIDAEGDISDLQEFESTTSSWISNTDEELSSIKSNHTSLVTVVDKTIKESVQLWFTKANTTAPSKPTTEVTNNNATGSNSYNKWNLAVPEYNASYPNYFYCYQWKYVDGTFGWSAVTRDIAMGETQSTARTAASDASSAVSTANTASSNASAAVSTANTASSNASAAVSTANTANSNASTALSTANSAASDASAAVSTANTASSNASAAVSTANSASSTATAAQNTANANIKSTVQLWFTKANTTAPSKPTAHITNNNATGSNSYNKWNLAVPEYNASYPNYFYCYEYQKGDNSYAWSDVVLDRATTENQANARSALTQVATKVETSTFNTLSQTVDSNTANITSLTTTTTNLRADLDNLEIGGRNLLVYKVDVGGRTTNYGNYGIILNCENADTYFYLYTWSRLVEGQEYTLSCDAEGVVSGTNIKFPLFSQNHWATGHLDIDKNGRCYNTFVMDNFSPETAVIDGRTCYVIGMDDNGKVLASGQGRITLKNFKLEKGSRPTDWTPAPEDMEASVTTISNTVNEVSQTATSNSSKISNLTTTLGTNADGTTKSNDIVHRTSAVEQDLSGFKTTVSETYQTKSAMSGYSTTSQMNTAIQQSANAITQSVSETYQTKSDMDDYSTTSEMNSAIDQKAGEITSSVSQTYATKTQAQGYATTAETNAKNDTATKLQSYSTTTQMNSAINQKADAITASVASTYTTKTDFDALKIGGRNLLKDSRASASNTSAWVSKFFDLVEDIPPNTPFTVSLQVDAVDLAYGGSGSKRIGIEAAIPPDPGGSGNAYRGVWIYDSGTFSKRISATGLVCDDRTIKKGQQFGIYIQNATSGTVTISNPKVELGNKVTDWSPAPEDLEAYADAAVTTAKAEIKVTTDGLTTEVGKKVGNNEVISKINQSAESVTIDAHRVNIVGAAIFTSGRLSETSLNNAYDAKGAANAVQTNLDSLKVGGRNLLVNSRKMQLGNASWANGVWRTAGNADMAKSRVEINDSPIGTCGALQMVGIQTTTSDTSCFGIDSMPREKDADYVFSMWARVVGGGSAQAGWALYSATVVDSNADGTWGGYATRTLDPNGAWTRIWVHAKSSASATTGNIYIGGAATDSTNKTIQMCLVKVEKGTKVTDWTQAPEDALEKAVPIYCRTNSSNAPATSVLPTGIVANTSDTGVTAPSSNGNGWTKMHMPRICSSNTAYKYLWTCNQLISVGGYLLGHTDIVADNGTTIIDGGTIITGTVAASAVNASSGTFNTANIPELTTNHIKGSVINAVNNSTETSGGTALTISANKVNIEGATIFTSGRLSQTSLNNAYDSKGSASAVQTDLNNLKIGGTNILLSTADYGGAAHANWSSMSVYTGVDGDITYAKVWHSTGSSWQTYLRQLCTYELNTPYTISLIARKTNTDGVNPRLSIRNDRNAAITFFTDGAEIDSFDWKHYEFTISKVHDSSVANEPLVLYATYTSAGGNTNKGALSESTAIQIAHIKLEKGTRATDWSPSPKDAIDKAVPVYKRTNSSTAPDAPTAIVTATTDQTSTGNWTKMHMPRICSTSTAYKYLWTCNQLISVGGYLLGNTDVVADNGTTVIDGDNIITGTVTADKLNATNINASKTLTVGAMTDAAAKTILNSNVQIGGRNLLLGSGTFVGGDAVLGSGAIADGGYGAAPKCIKQKNAWGGPYIHLGDALTRIGASVGDTVTLSIMVSCDSSTAVTTPNMYLYRANANSSTTGLNGGTDQTQLVIKSGIWKKLWCTFDVTEYALTATTTRFESSATTSYSIMYSAPKLEFGNKATDWTPAPEDELAKSQRIYIRSNQSSTNAITAPTSIVTRSDAVNNTWTLRRLPMIDSSDTTYKYCYTCEQLISNSGSFLGTTQIVPDESHTVIDGGNIITGSITANQIAGGTITSTQLDTTTNNKITASTNYIDAVSNQYGYRFAKDIIVYGESNKYYPVYFGFGNQNVPRETLIHRSYGDQAPSDWNTSTHKGGLTCRIKWNFGGWGGATYKVAVLDFAETYCNMVAKIVVGTQSGMCGTVWLRGGGTTGAVYHICSDQVIENNNYNCTFPYIGLTAGEEMMRSGSYSWTVHDPLSTVDTSNLSPLYVDELAKNAASKSSAISEEQRIYYRSSSSTKPNGNGLPTAWITETGDKYNSDATTSTGWSRKVTPIANGTGSSVTKYLYLWTCIQKKTVSGTVTYGDILLDDTTTVIDGGKIVTGSLSANAVSASSGAFDEANIPSLTANHIKGSVISAVNSSTETSGGNPLTISASKVNIEGATIFTSGRLSTTSLDNAYDAKGSASTVQTRLDNLQIGGRNLLFKFVKPEGRTTAGGDYGVVIPATQNADTYFSLYLHQNLTANKQYVISCKASGLLDGSYIYFPLFSQGHTAPGQLAITKNGLNYLVFTHDGTNGSATTLYGKTYYRLFMDDTNRWYASGQGAITLTDFKLEEGNKPTAWSPAPEDAYAKSVPIYCRTNSSNAPATSTLPTELIITNTSDTGVTAPSSNGNGWTLMHMPRVYSSNTNYKYLWTCSQLISVGGYLLGHTDIVADNGTTVIDGGTIITGTVAASAVNASSGTFDTANIPNLNASKINAGTLNIGRIPSGALNSELSGDIANAGKTASTYITNVDANGIQIHATNNPTSNYTQIDSDGMDVIKGGSSVAAFGVETRIGQQGASRVELTSNTIALIAENGSDALRSTTSGTEISIITPINTFNTKLAGGTSSGNVFTLDLSTVSNTAPFYVTIESRCEYTYTISTQYTVWSGNLAKICDSVQIGFTKKTQSESKSATIKMANSISAQYTYDAFITKVDKTVSVAYNASTSKLTITTPSYPTIADSQYSYGGGTNYVTNGSSYLRINVVSAYLSKFLPQTEMYGRTYLDMNTGVDVPDDIDESILTSLNTLGWTTYCTQ